MIKSQTWLPAAPPLMLASGLLLWGWQTEKQMLSVIMTLLLETARLNNYRIAFDNRDFNRITDYTSTFLFIMIVYLFYNHGSSGIFEILASLPLLLFPLILAQLYSDRQSLYSSNLFVSLRKLKKTDVHFTDNKIDISTPYFIICLISASEGNQHPKIFFIVVCLLLGWLFLRVRSRRYHIGIWLFLLALVTATAYTTQSGLRTLQTYLEASYIDYFYRLHSFNRNSDRQTTAIGSIGTLKFSDRIIYRVKAHQQLSSPLYLSEASYNYYAYGTWTNIDTDELVIDPEIDGKSWLLTGEEKADKKAEITAYHKEDEVILPVSQGTTKISQLNAFQLARDNTDSIAVEVKPGWNSWQMHYLDEHIFSPAPISADLHVGQTYKDDLSKLAESLDLSAKSDEETIRHIEKFFKDNFTYTLHQKRRYPRGKYLSRFLFEDKKGHCEYFATATTLLLRTAGIPARYVVGYVVDEFSDFENQYVARSRHAHSWVMAYVNEQWIRIDTTPSVWAELESENESSLQFLADIWSWSRLTSHIILESRFVKNIDGQWLMITLILILAVKIYLRKRISGKDSKTTRKGQKNIQTGLDSPLFDYIRKLELSGFKRHSGETLNKWCIRIAADIPDFNYSRIISMHNEYRFNPGTKITIDDLKNEINRLPNPESLQS